MPPPARTRAAAHRAMAFRSATLLERISAAKRGGILSVREDRAAAMRSVLANLGRVLNTRLGAASAQPDLGTASPHELLQGFPGTAKQTQAAIARCIERYEPRLCDVKVDIGELDPNKRDIAFQVSARLAGGDVRDRVSFHTAIGADGHIRLSDA